MGLFILSKDPRTIQLNEADNLWARQVVSSVAHTREHILDFVRLYFVPLLDVSFLKARICHIQFSMMAAQLTASAEMGSHIQIKSWPK